MRRFFTFSLLLVLLAGCGKTVEKIQEDMVIKAMVDGQWVVTTFIDNGTTVTASFMGYKFQYYSNKTVDAIKNGTLEKTGTWDGNASTMTTTANFSNVSNPLDLINGNWHIDNSGWTFVEATQTVGSNIKKMRLDKL